MELNQIRYFVVLARTLHFTKAAEACNVSQPALTKAIQKLEEELGGPLFHRERSLTQLTDLGRLMLAPLERALASAQEAKVQAEAFRRRQSSPLRIGLEYSVPTSVLTPVLAVLRQQCEDIEMVLRQGSQAKLCERMLASELDLALLVNGPELNERLHRWPLFAERYVLICPPEHRFRDADAVPVDDLADECLLLNEDAHCPVRQFVARICEQKGIRPRRQYFADSQEQIVEMVRASLGISVAGECLPGAASLLRRPLSGESDSRTIVVAAITGRQLGPTPALFLKLMRSRGWAKEHPSAAATVAS